MTVTVGARLRALPALVAVALIAGCGPSAPPAAPDVQPGTDPGSALSALVEAYFDAWLALHPTMATAIGDHRYDDRLSIWISDEYLEANRELNERFLAEALALDAGRLGESDRVTLELFLHDRKADRSWFEHPAHLLPFDQLNSFPNDFAVLGSGAGVHPFDEVEDYENFLGRIGDFRRFAELAIARFREGVERGVVHPRIVVERMLPQLAAQLVERPEDSVFWGPVAEMPEDIAAPDRDRLTAAWRRAISEDIVPAFRAMHEFLAGEYLPAARPTDGWSGLPGGEAWYAREVTYWTGTAREPDAVHRTGLAEVARLTAEMEAVRERIGFAGDLGAFLEYLRSAPVHYWTSAEAMLADYRAMRARVEAALPSLFETFPRAGFEIRPIEAFRADSAVGAEYESPSPDGSRPGVFYLNTHDLARMPRWGMSTLFLHEALPGHHFQGAIALELEELPRFRRYGFYPAYVEGWALYAEDLGVELGLLDDPYQYFGKLNDEMLRAMRLVVDTGLHRFGWTRERAIDYMRAHSSLPEGEIVTEVERYMVWPGQALAYKIGQLELRRLRREAGDALGKGFDLRAWHTMVLGSGEMPMAILAARQRRWLETRAGG